MKLFLLFRLILLIMLVAIGFTSFSGNNSYLCDISFYLGFLAYLVAYLASFLINYYPDPVKNKSLTSDKLAKIISRKFYRAMGFRYLVVLIGIFLLITNGFASLGVLLGVGVSVVSINIIVSCYKRTR